MYFDEGLSNLRSSKNDNEESDDLPRNPRVLIERLIKFNVRTCRDEVRSERVVLRFLSIAIDLKIGFKSSS